MLKNLGFIFMLLSIISCGSLRQQDRFEFIGYGQGGGISGEVKGFEINADGQIHSTSKMVNGEVEKKEIRKLSKKELREIAKKIDQSKALTYNYKELDNYYYYLEIHKGAQKNYITWGGNKTPSKGIRELYDYLYFLSN